MDTQNYSQQFEKHATRKTGHRDDRYSTRMQKRAQGSCSFKAPSLVLRAIAHLELTVKCLGVLCTLWPELQLLSRWELPAHWRLPWVMDLARNEFLNLIMLFSWPEETIFIWSYKPVIFMDTGQHDGWNGVMPCIHRENGCQILVLMRVLALVLVMIYSVIMWISNPFPGNQNPCLTLC